jgi:cathepsin C
MFSLLLALAAADLPVHCLRHQVVGKWRFHLGPLSPTRSSCGHEAPDVESAQPKISSLLNTTTTSLDVALHDPSVAESAGKNGSWTMVYDEGFFAEVGDHTLFAFSHFELSDPNSVHWFQPRIHGKKVFRSVCAKTEVGWYHDKKTDQWGCFYGERTDVKDPNAHRDFLSFINVVDDPAYEESLTLAQHEDVAKQITSVADGWVAAAYPEYAGLSLAQLNKRAGTARYHVKREEASSFLALVRKEAPEEAKAAKADAGASLPEELSWRNVNGTSWVDPVSDQGECGSCYAVSSNNMMTARHRVAAGNPHLESFATTFSLYCADVNQGCNGGYPFLSSMWAKDVGLVTTSCAGKYHVDTNMKCPSFLERAEKKQALDKCMAGQEAAVKSFGYIGGYYGACTEEGMMRALQDGPITVALEPAMDFMYYKSGVYSSVKSKKITPPSPEWYKVDHAVLVVGYGVDKTGPEPKKYWLVQNSWGKDWGEDGYIRVAKGENESGIEFQAIEAKVVASKTNLHSFLADHRVHHEA